jgi:hypothetical protein
MWIYARPASANISFEVQTPTGDDSDATKRTEYISFQVLPTDERDHLDLDTGEVFQNYNYARSRNKHENLIAARLTIKPASDDSDYKRNAMQYFESFPATIFFTVYVAPTTFRELANNVKNGLLPETITIGFDRDLFSKLTNPQQQRLLEYSWEPDGSGMVWHNQEKENQAIPIDSIKFDYAVLRPRYDEKTNQILPISPEMIWTRVACSPPHDIRWVVA